MSDNPRKKVASEVAGKVKRDSSGKGYRVVTKSTKGGQNTVKSYSKRKVTGDPGDYKTRKTVKSIKDKNVKRGANGEGVVTVKGATQKKYGN